MLQQAIRSREWRNSRNPFFKDHVMPVFELIRTGVLVLPGSRLLTKQLGQERFPTHADAPMDFPQGDDDAGGTQRFGPGRNVLVVTIDQRAVKIEEDRR